MAKAGQPGRDLHLHVDRAGLDPLKGYGRNPLNHATLIAQSKVAEPGGKSRTLREHKQLNRLVFGCARPAKAR